MASKPSVLVIGDIVHVKKELEEWGSSINFIEYPTGKRADFLSQCAAGSFDGVVAMYRSNESAKVTGPFDAELINALPASLKYICHNGAGYDNVDVAACTARGISFSNTPKAVDDATADIAMFLLLGAVRRLGPSLQSVVKGNWRPAPFHLGRDPKRLTLGILGLGGIGSALARRATAFGMTVLYHNRRRVDGSPYEYVAFDELLRTSDVLSLNLSLTPETRHIIGAAELAAMRRGVVLVNTARGGLVDEAALVEALRAGQVGGVGMDVFEREPEVHEGLLEMAASGEGRVFLLPHVGTATVETQRDMELLTFENLRGGLAGTGLVTQVPEQR